jgi:ABC-2 type transport system permease protein
VTSFLYVINTLSFFVSGHMFPLDLLPAPWDSILKALPFSYLAYFPAAVFVGKIHGEELVRGLVIEVIWALVFIVLARVLYRYGLRHYSAYGG